MFVPGHCLGDVNKKLQPVDAEGLSDYLEKRSMVSRYHGDDRRNYRYHTGHTSVGMISREN